MPFEVPDNPKIYHITHMDNLSGIVDEGVIWSDAERLGQQINCNLIGISHIKRRRLSEITVPCCDDEFVGSFVPFNFCPRSVMLFILHRGNHPDLQYTEGQTPLVHLQADLKRVIEWANEHDTHWCFSLQNAGTRYAKFHSSIAKLNRLNWNAIDSNDFRSPALKEAKQAEFLVHTSFPWELVEHIGVCRQSTKRVATEAISEAQHQPPINIQRDWYF